MATELFKYLRGLTSRKAKMYLDFLEVKHDISDTRDSFATNIERAMLSCGLSILPELDMRMETPPTLTFENSDNSPLTHHLHPSRTLSHVDTQWSLPYRGILLIPSQLHQGIRSRLQ